MLFVIAYKTSLAANRTGQERFKETGGAPPPQGVRKIASYHYLDGSGGYSIAETDDPIALAKWANQWSDVIVMDVRPVLTDEQMGQVLGS
jgi:hypothetical protein